MNKWISAALIILGLAILAFILSQFSTDNITAANTIVVIPIEGEITGTGSDQLFGATTATPKNIIEKIDSIKNNKNVEAVIFEINSPGGAAVASQEIADAIRELNKTKYAVIKDVGASGAYWIASATDKIYASPVSITGSIGVISSYLEFSGLFEKYGIGYQRLVSGERKDIGIPYRELTLEEEKILQNKLNIVHEFFIREVARNRKLDYETCLKNHFDKLVKFYDGDTTKIGSFDKIHEEYIS